MLTTIKQLFNRKNKDLRKKILFTFGALFIFKLGTAIIVPGIDKNSLTGNLGFFELINALGGGAMEKFSIFALGVMPYITASIIIQLLSMDIIPYLSELTKCIEGCNFEKSVFSPKIVLSLFTRPIRFNKSFCSKLFPCKIKSVSIGKFTPSRITLLAITVVISGISENFVNK